MDAGHLLRELVDVVSRGHAAAEVTVLGCDATRHQVAAVELHEGAPGEEGELVLHCQVADDE